MYDSENCFSSLGFNAKAAVCALLASLNTCQFKSHSEDLHLIALIFIHTSFKVCLDKTSFVCFVILFLKTPTATNMKFTWTYSHCINLLDLLWMAGFIWELLRHDIFPQRINCAFSLSSWSSYVWLWANCHKQIMDGLQWNLVQVGDHLSFHLELSVCLIQWWVNAYNDNISIGRDWKRKSLERKKEESSD